MCGAITSKKDSATNVYHPLPSADGLWLAFKSQCWKWCVLTRTSAHSFSFVTGVHLHPWFGPGGLFLPFQRVVIDTNNAEGINLQLNFHNFAVNKFMRSTFSCLSRQFCVVFAGMLTGCNYWGKLFNWKNCFANRNRLLSAIIA